MEFNKLLKALRGDECLLLIFSKEVANKLNIENQEWLTFEVRNKELVIKKIVDGERSLKTEGTKEEEIGIAVV